RLTGDAMSGVNDVKGAASVPGPPATPILGSGVRGVPGQRLPSPYRPECEAADAALAFLDGQLDWSRVAATAEPWVEAVRRDPAPFWALESLLAEYPISSDEGLALMRLAEALLRVPDRDTAVALTADQLSRADFSSHGGRGLAAVSARALALAKVM